MPSIQIGSEALKGSLIGAAVAIVGRRMFRLSTLPLMAIAGVAGYLCEVLL